MKYGYTTELDRKVREYWGQGKIGDMTACFMMDFYQPLMKRKTVKPNELAMLQDFKEMVAELLNHLENEVETTK